MGRKQDVGRSSDPPAAVGRVHLEAVGRAQVEQPSIKERLPEHESTQMIKLGQLPPQPVFVDPSGTRRRRLLVWAYVLVAGMVLVLAAIWFSQLGAPVLPPGSSSCPTSSSAGMPDRAHPVAIVTASGGECRQ